MARRNLTKALGSRQDLKDSTIPHLWAPRSYQGPLWDAMPIMATHGDKTYDRFVLPWHRRAGKDLTALNMTIREMTGRVGLYLHILPTYRQAKAVVWDGKDLNGVPFLDHFPPNAIKSRNETELMITLNPFPGQYGYGTAGADGSIWQLKGADDIDSFRGMNPFGVVFSEYSEMDPAVWQATIQPVLEANRGWAIFIFTPKGRNHSHKLYEMAKQDERWFAQLLTIEDTKQDAPGESGEPCVSLAYIDQMRKEGVSEEIIRQEFYCDFSGFLKGTIFGDMITVARKDGRVTRVPYSSSYPVGTCWDIGRTDSTAIWFYQRIGQQILFIDYYEDNLKGADFYAKLLREKPYIVSRLILPHDARVKGFTATHSTEEYFQRVFRGVTVAEKASVQSGIDMTRRMFSRFVFDEARCARGIECLEQYRRKWDEEKHDYSGEPIHSEWSHGADAIRTGVVGGLDTPLEWMAESAMRNPSRAETDFSIFADMPSMVQ